MTAWPGDHQPDYAPQRHTGRSDSVARPNHTPQQLTGWSDSVVRTMAPELHTTNHDACMREAVQTMNHETWCAHPNLMR